MRGILLWRGRKTFLGKECVNIWELCVTLKATQTSIIDTPHPKTNTWSSHTPASFDSSQKSDRSYAWKIKEALKTRQCKPPANEWEEIKNAVRLIILWGYAGLPVDNDGTMTTSRYKWAVTNANTCTPNTIALYLCRNAPLNLPAPPPHSLTRYSQIRL